MSIEVENLTKFYGEQKALDKINFTIGKPAIVGFLGPNGAGKSTLMKILTTFLRASEGNAKVNGFDVLTHTKDVQNSIGYLPENNPLYPDMYVREYLSFNARIHRVDAERIEKVIELCQLKSEVHKKIKQLSKGYKQRVGLASAILHDPDVLILDEPTTGLDPNQLIEIRKLISDLGQSKTVFLSTHIMQEVEAMCERVIMISNGKIVADSSLAELRKGEKQIIIVEFDYKIEEAFFKDIPNLENVRNVFGMTYELVFAPGEDMRPAIFDFAKDKGLKILQLNLKNTSLESLFNELTQSSNISSPV